MTYDELLKRFPYASSSFLQRNADDLRPRLRTIQSKPDERLPLDNLAAPEEAGWYDAPCRFEIVFTVYSRNPCDWDGYDIKALQDFLITAGIIPGDGWKQLSGRVLSRKAATEAEERTEIQITALKGEHER
jgi:hypothetical protein